VLLLFLKYFFQNSSTLERWKIEVLFQAFGFLSGSLLGFANVLQCVIAKTPLAKKCGGVKI
jgi:hypothetical protein